MDLVSDILSKVRLSSSVYFRSDFSAPWGMDIPSGPYAQFHIITRGQCLLKWEKEELQLFAGDIVVFPRGAGHWLADKKGSEKRNGQDVVKAIQGGDLVFKGNTIETTLVCGHFEFDRNFDHPFVKQLPDILHITDAERKDLSWLDNITNLVVQETGSQSPGSRLIVRKLGEVLFVHVLRAFMERNGHGNGFLAAMRDQRIAKALHVIHNHPQKDWTLSALAQAAGMSRTSFSGRFKALAGMTPLSYITNWRVIQAKELLTEGDDTVGEIGPRLRSLSPDRPRSPWSPRRRRSPRCRRRSSTRCPVRLR